MNNVYSCAYVAILFRVHEFFGMRSVEEKMMHAVNSVYSMDKADIKKRFFHIFAGNHQKLLYKKLQHSYTGLFWEKWKDDDSQGS